MPHRTAISEPRSVDDLVADLHALGLRPGDAVMVHASLRAIGPVQGGHAGVVEAIDRALGPDGTSMMVLGADDPFDFVHERPHAERAALLADAEPFDAAVTPAQPDVGWLAEVFRRTPGTIVSDHPEGRFGARGAHAARLMADPPWHDYYGPGSALQRLCAMGGRVLRLGADPETVTVLHYAEYLVDLPDKRRVCRTRKVLRDGVACIVDVQCLDDSDGIVDWPVDYFGEIVRAYLKTGRASVGRVGGAHSELLDARDIVAFGVDWMARHFGG